MRCWRFFLFQAEDGIRDLVRSRGLGDVYKRQVLAFVIWGMGQVLTALGRQMVEKSKASKMLSIVILSLIHI